MKQGVGNVGSSNVNQGVNLQNVQPVSISNSGLNTNSNQKNIVNSNQMLYTNNSNNIQG